MLVLLRLIEVVEGSLFLSRLVVLFLEEQKCLKEYYCQWTVPIWLKQPFLREAIDTVDRASVEAAITDNN